MAKRKSSTIAALIEEKPRRGRPRRSVSRKNVYVTLTKKQKKKIKSMAADFPNGLTRADIPDMAISLLAARLEVLRRAVADRDRDIPEGITDLDSLYLLWDTSLPDRSEISAWTSIRLSPQQNIELGRAHGVLNALYGANRSDVYALSLSLLDQFFSTELLDKEYHSLDDVVDWINRIYL